MGGECCLQERMGKHQVVVVGWSGLPIVAATYHYNDIIPRHYIVVGDRRGIQQTEIVTSCERDIMPQKSSIMISFSPV